MRLSKIVLICLPILWASISLADIKTIELASEVRLSDFRAPQSANGVASFKACTVCDLQVVNVTGGTRYFVNGESVGLVEFRRRISLVPNRDEEIVIVRHHLEDDVVTVISVNL